MIEKCAVVSSLALSVAAMLAAPVGAQNLVQSTAETIPAGEFRLTAYPVGLFGRNGGPDSWGGATRLGYGITGSLDVEGKAAIFDGFSLVGFDTAFRVARGALDLSISLGAHKALIARAADSTALDSAWLVGARVLPRLRLYGGMDFSLESLDHVARSGFSRVYLVPGLDCRLSRRIDFVSQLGLGLNDNSPNYLTTGFSFYLPGRAARDGDDRR